MRNCVIVGARPVDAALLSLVEPGAYVVAADAGWRQAEKLGLVPNLVVGDFDSAPQPPHASELRVLPTHKDDTDTHFAAKMAVERGYDNILMLGCMGGRLDHTLANFATLLWLARQGVAAQMADTTSQVWCMGPGLHRVARQGERYLSLFAAGGPVRGLTLSGVRYPLRQHTLMPDSPLCASNEFADAQADLSWQEGYLYVTVADRQG